MVEKQYVLINYTDRYDIMDIKVCYPVNMKCQEQLNTWSCVYTDTGIGV